MELKLIWRKTEHLCSILLIVPYGIEIKKNFLDSVEILGF